MIESINDFLLRETIRHQIELQRYEAGVVARMIAVLDRADKRIAAELAVALQEIDPSLFKMERLESLLTSIRELSKAAYEQIGKDMRDELKEFNAYELSYQHQALVTHLPAVVHVASVSANQVYTAAMARPFQGVLLKEVWKDLDTQAMKRLRQTIANGFVEGKTTDQIIREVRGTRANNFKDGIVEKSRRDIEAVVRTAIANVAGVAQDNMMEANADLLKAVQWSSTLDTRTSQICRPRDGKLYTPVDHKPIGHKLPWLAGAGRSHWRCRSSQVPVLKSHKELGIDVPEIVIEGKTRASMDGQVAAETTYADWLKKQSAARQDEVLGPTRGRLMREGKLSLDDMYSARGKPLTLDELRKKDAEAFKLAGL